MMRKCMISYNRNSLWRRRRRSYIVTQWCHQGHRFTFCLLLLLCVHFVLMITKGLPEIQASHLDIDNTMSCEERTLFYWVSLNEVPFPEVPHQALPCMPVFKSITGRGAELPIQTHASQNSPLGLGPAALKHRPHIRREISKLN